MKILGVLSLCFSACFAVNTVDILASDSEYSNLTSFIRAAGLEDTLRSGVFTIFAPTNDAFKLVDPATLTALGNDVDALKNLLLYHVVPGKVPSSSASNELKLTSVEGHKVRFNIYPHTNEVTAEGAKVISFDKQADNGVIHTLNHVMMPPKGTIVDVVKADPNLSTLLSYVTATGIASNLTADGLTLFAPTNDAFSALPSRVISQLKANPKLLKDILLYHVVPHTEWSEGLYNRESLATLDSHHDRITVHAYGGSIRINNGGSVTKADIPATNGVVHQMKHVIIPYRYIPALTIGK